jgi:hypothetical protein
LGLPEKSPLLVNPARQFFATALCCSLWPSRRRRSRGNAVDFMLAPLEFNVKHIEFVG